MPTTAGPFVRASLVPLLLLGACLDPQKLDDTGSDDTGPGADGPTVFDVNDGTVPQDSVVTLEGLVVTSPVNRDGDGFFVADPAGGPNSGLYVWRQLGMEGLEAVPGDEVRITGTPTEFYGWMELVVGSVDDIEITGEATPPAPANLGSGDGVDWEEYESVVVTLESQTVTAIDGFNTGTLSGGIKLDDGFQYLEYDCRGAFESVSGVVFYEYEAHSLNPRTDDDLGAYTAPSATTATIAQIQSGEVCGPVTVEDAVVTAPGAEDEGSTTFFVQDAGGGPSSGMAVYVPDAVVNPSVGETYTLSGSAEEFYDFTQLRVATTDDMTATGTGEPVSESLSAAPSDWEAYEGALVTLGGVEVTSEASYGEVETNYAIKLDTLYYEHNAEQGDTFSTVTGVVYYSFSEWKLEPRSAADLEP